MQSPWGLKMAPRGKRLSSTPLEILFFLNGWYYATYFLLELFIFLYKGLLLPYPTANLVLDVVMLLLYLGIEVIRLFFDGRNSRDVSGRSRESGAPSWFPHGCRGPSTWAVCRCFPRSGKAGHGR
nr:transmembrane protein 216 isoform X3 [Oryctolagus cuniculus]